MTTNVKSKLFKAEKTQWVIPCNPAYYDVCGVFNKLDKVEWKQSTNVNEGDIVYIYVTSPIKEIRYKCVARKVDLDYADTEKDREFILKGDNYENYGRYMELELITKYKENKFTLENLKQNGLKSVQGPSKVSEELANYIKSNEIDMIKKTLQEENNIEYDLKNYIDKINVDENFTYKYDKKKKQKYTIQNGIKTYIRDRKVAMNALKKANHKCEVDSEHEVFLRRNVEVGYTESHHLVPMAYSDIFDVSLDVEENMVSLCSHCHNLLHYGKDFERVLEKLYYERVNHLNKVGIYISFDQLREMYL